MIIDELVNAIREANGRLGCEQAMYKILTGKKSKKKKIAICIAMLNGVQDTEPIPEPSIKKHTTLYQATNETRPIPGTLSDSATGSILKAFLAGATFDGWKQTTTQELKGEIDA